MLVNVIMPAYNAAATIEKSIESILNQTYTEWNLYVVNDCSTDNTADVVQRIMDSEPDAHIVLLNTWQNSGVSAARNTALEYIESLDEKDYLIAYCDSDDWWFENHLTDSIKCMAENNADLVFSTPCWVRESGEKVYPTFDYDTSDISKLHRRNHIWISSVVHRQVGERFDSEVDSLEDWDMWIRLYDMGFKFCEKKSVSVTYLVKVGGMASKGPTVGQKVLDKNDIVIQPVQPKIRLNLGCGDQLLPGWTNCDLHNPAAEKHFDASHVPYPNDSVDEIAAYHLIEHFRFEVAMDVLREWKRVLKPGGKLIIETPDFIGSCREVATSNDEEWIKQLCSHFLAWPWLPGQTHYFLYSEAQLRLVLIQCGFVNVRRVVPDSLYARCNPTKHHIYLKMECEKPK